MGTGPGTASLGQASFPEIEFRLSTMIVAGRLSIPDIADAVLLIETTSARQKKLILVKRAVENWRCCLNGNMLAKY